MSDPGLTAARALEVAEALEKAGNLVEAVDALAAAVRMRRDVDLERRLVRLRHAAAPQLTSGPRAQAAPQTWPHFSLDSVPDGPKGPREIAASALDLATLESGLLRNGHLVVRGLFPADRVARLRDDVEQAFVAYDACGPGGAGAARTAATDPWYDPLAGIPDGDLHRAAVRSAQGVLACDVPRALFEYLETVRDLGLMPMISEYLGERPGISWRKTTLRRADPSDFRAHASPYHQDGAFLGHGIRTLNLWVALTRCGVDAPGMDLIPTRIEHLLTRGGPGAYFDWAIGPDTVAREMPGVAPWRPEFQEGDAVFFDHWFVHRTAATEAMTKLRYAIECWFFAPSVYRDEPAMLLCA